MPLSKIQTEVLRLLASHRDPERYVASAALDDAEAFVMRMPTDKSGLLFLQGSILVQPDPGRLEGYQTHAGQRRGQWPASAEIAAATSERYTRPPRP